MQRHRVEQGQDGWRLDRVLATIAEVGSREKARQAVRSGKVHVNGGPIDAEDGGRLVYVGDEIGIEWSRPGTNRRVTAGREALVRAHVQILHEDRAILVANKPSGLLTDAADQDQARHDDTLRKRVRAWLGGAEAWPVHRIDRDTTGIVLFAKTERAREHLKAQWGERTPLRQYLAVLEGRFPTAAGHWADWMAWDRGAKVQRPTPPNARDAVLAEADWSVVEPLDGATLVEVRLISGRRNQIRLHAQLAGHPMVGDPLYRGPKRTHRFDRQALHAWRLGVRHPEDDHPVAWECPLPPDMDALVRSLRLGRSEGPPAPGSAGRSST